jgi:hypothetical protein
MHGGPLLSHKDISDEFSRRSTYIFANGRPISAGRFAEESGAEVCLQASLSEAGLSPALSALSPGFASAGFATGLSVGWRMAAGNDSSASPFTATSIVRFSSLVFEPIVVLSVT